MIINRLDDLQLIELQENDNEYQEVEFCSFTCSITCSVTSTIN